MIKSSDVDIAVMTLSVARAVGSLCAASGHDDIVDVHVALCAWERGHAVVTSDPDDIPPVVGIAEPLEDSPSVRGEVIV